MLKKICGLFLGLVVLAGSACVTPTHASSAATVIITHIQTGSPTSALSEFVALYNNSSVDIDITGWCLSNKAQVKFACFSAASSLATASATAAPTATTMPGRLVLPAYSSATAASEVFADEMDLPAEAFTVTGTIANRSSGSITNSADTISLLDNNSQVVDSHAWASAPASGKVLQRVAILGAPLVYATTGNSSDWQVVKLTNLPAQQAIEIEPEEPEPQPTPGGNDDGDTSGSGSSTNPDSGPSTNPGDGSGSSSQTGAESGTGDTATAAIAAEPFITELLPNPVGSDVGNEFIELFNPGDGPVSLAEYRLHIGNNLENVYSFPEGAVLPPGAYTVFMNSVIKYTLLNTTSAVQLFKQGVAIGDVIRYESPKSGFSWALIGEAWAYTVPTPGAFNGLAADLGDTADVAASTKSTAKAVAALKLCTANQYRSPETNRCRALTSSSGTTSTPCAAGKERNPGTNRCVTVKKLAEAGYGLKESDVAAGQKGVSWYLWAAIAGIVLLIIGYGVWEWRLELKQLWARIVQRFAGRSD